MGEANMRIGTLACIGIACFLATATARTLSAAEPATEQAESDPVAAELNALRAEYEKLEA